MPIGFPLFQTEHDDDVVRVQAMKARSPTESISNEAPR
jgi:hypothetical protein